MDDSTAPRKYSPIPRRERNPTYNFANLLIKLPVELVVPRKIGINALRRLPNTDTAFPRNEVIRLLNLPPKLDAEFPAC